RPVFPRAHHGRPLPDVGSLTTLFPIFPAGKTLPPFFGYNGGTNMTSKVLHPRHNLAGRNQSIDSEGGYQMKMRKTCLLVATMMALLLQPAFRVGAQARAQEKPPAVVIAIASYDKMLAD